MRILSAVLVNLDVGEIVRMMNWLRSSRRGSSEKLFVNVSSIAGLLQDLETSLQTGQGFSIATLNLDHVVKLRQMPEFRAAYLRQTHITADGNPIVWLSRLAGQRISLVPGSDLIDPVLKIAARNTLPIALLGSTPDSLQKAADEIHKHYPGAKVVARIAPEMGFEPTGPQAEACIQQLQDSGARLCLIALGAPKQEIFAIHARDRLPRRGFLSIGAGVDFISGNQTRAPKLVRRLAMEWLWRLVLEPRRFARRYWECIVILPPLVYTAIKIRTEIEDRAA